MDVKDHMSLWDRIRDCLSDPLAFEVSSRGLNLGPAINYHPDVSRAGTDECAVSVKQGTLSESIIW